MPRKSAVTIPEGYGMYRYRCAECESARYLCLHQNAALRPTETILGCLKCGPARKWHPDGATPLPLPEPEPEPLPQPSVPTAELVALLAGWRAIVAALPCHQGAATMRACERELARLVARHDPYAGTADS